MASVSTSKCIFVYNTLYILKTAKKNVLIHEYCVSVSSTVVKVKVHPCTGTETLYRLYAP